MAKLKDTSKMPWGIHAAAGLRMQDVPASYFHWLWTKKGFKDNKVDPVAIYIREKLNALKMEYPDGIWG